MRGHYIGDCDGDQCHPVADSNRPLLEVRRQDEAQAGEIPRSERCLRNKLQPSAGTTAVVLPHHGSLLATAGRGCGEEPWTSQDTM